MNEDIPIAAAVTEAAPKLACPPGAADCHMHFYGTREDYPLAPT